MTEFKKLNKNSNLKIEGTCCIWLNAELPEESSGVFSFFIYRAENNLKTNWISVSDQNARAISMTEVQKFNKNINLTIEGTCYILLYAELHEVSNGIFSFFIYRAENNLKTDWISVTQIRTRALLYDGIAKIQWKYKFNDWRDMLYMIVWRIARGIEWCV